MTSLSYLCIVSFCAATALVGRASVITVTTADNLSDPNDGVTSLVEALNSAQAGDTIGFNIPGVGPHRIVTPLGGYPFIVVDGLTLDGYSQPGASPNTQPFDRSNTAHLQIILDSSGEDLAESSYPDRPDLIARRSTRMVFEDGSDIPGYGDSENGILAALSARNLVVRGVSFLARHTAGTKADPSIYGVALARGAVGARIQGCWFGLHPDGASVQGFRSSVAAFRYRTNLGGELVERFSEGLIFGTDGDGHDDRAEANSSMGAEIALALELPGARISGNRFNVFPDGVTFLDVRTYCLEHQIGSMEVLENGRSREGTLIGTNGDGVSDAEERNVMAPVNYRRQFEFYGGTPASGTVIAGNLIGVSVDGLTLYPHELIGTPDLMSMDNVGAVRVGSNGDGRSDDLEANRIHGLRGSRFCDAGRAVRITARGNELFGNGFDGFPFLHRDRDRDFLLYYADLLENAPTSPEELQPVLLEDDGAFLVGHLPPVDSERYPYSLVDVYLRDPSATASGRVLPGRHLGSFVEGSTQDGNQASGSFRVRIETAELPAEAEVVVAVTYSTTFGALEAGSSVTGPVSAGMRLSSHPVESKDAPTLSAHRDGDAVLVSWNGVEGLFRLEVSEDGLGSGWRPVMGAAAHTLGANRYRLETGGMAAFYRLRSF